MLSVLQQLFLLTYPALYAFVALSLPRRDSLRFVRIFGVVIHEFGHAVAALLTCTPVVGLAVNAMEGGAVHLLLGGRGRLAQKMQIAVIAPAGYLGESLLGGFILVGSGVPGIDVAVTWLASVLMLFAAYVAGRRRRLWLDALLLCWWALTGAVASLRPGVSSPIGWVSPLLVGSALMVHSLDDVHDDTIRRVHPDSDASLFAREVLGNEKRSLLLGKLTWILGHVWHIICVTLLFVLLRLPPQHGVVWDRYLWFVPTWVALGCIILVRIM